MDLEKYSHPYTISTEFETSECSTDLFQPGDMRYLILNEVYGV